MTDEHNPPQEPEPGTTEWLLAQLSGGRLDSRRERREAEAALEARGVQFDVETGAITLPVQPDAQQSAKTDAGATDARSEQPQEDGAAEEQQTPDAGADERPKARFSWQTGTLEAVDPPRAADDRSDEGDRDEEGAEVGAPAARDDDAVDDGDPAAGFRWNLLPTADSDPALTPELELPESMRRASTAADTTPVAEPAPAAEASPAAESAPAPRDLPLAEPAPTTPDAPDAPDNVTAAATPTLLPPGTTAREFDPFAQDLFAPEGAAGTPVPSVDEFTIPDDTAHDDERSAQASVPTQAIDGREFLPTQAMDAQEFLPTQAMPTAGTASTPRPTPTPSEPDAAEKPSDGAPADVEVSSNWTDITDMLGAEPETVESSVVPEWPPPEGTFDGFAQAVAPAADAIAQAVAPVTGRQAGDRSDSGLVEHHRRPAVNRWLIVVAAVLVAVLIAVLLFAIGRAVANGRHAAAATSSSHATVASRTSASASPSPAASVSVTPSATPVLPPTGTLPAGQTYQWDQLRGGECINPFGGAWAQQYAVVACTSPHGAQLVYTAPFSSNPAAPFPGEQAIASQINLLCSKPGVIDMTAAGAYSDMQIVASYPVNAAQWAAGQRNYYCFVTRSSGQPLTSSVQGPGPGQ